MELKIVNGLERPDLIAKGDEIVEEVWPEFMLNDAVANEFFPKLYEVFPQFQYWLLDNENIVGIGNCIPLSWNKELDELPDEGWDWALEKGFRDHESKRSLDLLCALSITIHPNYQGSGLSAEMIKAMTTIGKEYHFKKLIVPVRPTLKARYPLTDIRKYIGWKREDGLHFDPWLRVHFRLGGKFIKICDKAMLIDGNVKDWCSWTGMVFPEDGEYVIPGALRPVKFDLERDRGVYLEPNVWILHLIEKGRS